MVAGTNQRNKQWKRAILGIVVLTILLASLIVAVGVFYLHTANDPINTSGNINSATAWSTQHSPYNMTGNITVANGVQLTIQAGVTVNFNGYTMQVDGTLDAIGNSNANITFNDAQIIFSQSSKGWNQQTNSGCIIEKCVFNGSQIIINNCAPKINGDLLVGVQSGPSSIAINGGSPIISNNVITGNIHPDLYGSYGYSNIEISNGDQANITNNTIEDGMIGICIDAGINSSTGTTTITNNFIENNTDAGIYFGSPLTAIIENNTITQNYRGFRIDSYANESVLAYNNIFDNNNNVFLEPSSQQPSNINATYNWWGTTNQQAISQAIYDSKNNLNLGTVNFVPFLTAPNS